MASLMAFSRISLKLKFRELSCLSTICRSISLSLKKVYVAQENKARPITVPMAKRIQSEI